MQSTFDFLSHGGEMGALMRAHDWGATPLGPPQQWPEILKTTVRLLLTSNHPMFIWWGKDLIQFYNDAYRQTMGPERHPSALGQRGRECWEEIWDIIGPQIEFVMAGGGATWHEDQLVPVTRHGKREDVWWTYGYSPIEDSLGVQGVLVVCNDVTLEHRSHEQLRELNRQLVEQIRQTEEAQRREAYEMAERLHAEQALTAQRQAESERLRALFRQAPGFMAVVRGPDHVFEFANAAYLRFVGERELLAKPVRQALPELEGQGFFELLDQVFASGDPFSAMDVPVLLRRQPGGPFTQSYVDFVYQPIVDIGNRVSGIFIEGFDVTERKRAQTALRASEERLKEGMLAARMVVWDWDLETGQIRFSENTATLFGTTWTHVDDLWQCIVPEDAMRARALREEAVAAGSSYEDVVRLIRPDNRKIVWLHVRGNVICDQDGKARTIRGVFVDVSERKLAEQNLREADRRKDQFLAMLAHELRNPLAPLKTAADLLGLIPQDATRLQRIHGLITRQVTHMTGLIDDLLDVSRVNSGLIVLDKQPLDIQTIVMESIEQVQPLIEARRHRLTVDVTSDPAMVIGDHKRLVQVLTNLLQNSAKYTQEGGCISLSAATRADKVVIDIRDNGVGIDVDLLPHVFELFTQGKRSSDRSQGGLGLGLALVQNLVALHGGRVTAESEGQGKGTTVTVVLPCLMKDHRGAAPVGRHSAAPEPFTPLRVMVVDDNADAAHALAMFLEASGHQVTVEHDPHSALARAAVVAPDVYLLDIGLPGMTGNELARRLRKMPQAARATLVAVTGYGNEYDKDASLSAGFDSYFVKPLDAAQLQQLLSSVHPENSRPAAGNGAYKTRLAKH